MDLAECLFFLQEAKSTDDVIRECFADMGLCLRQETFHHPGNPFAVQEFLPEFFRGGIDGLEGVFFLPRRSERFQFRMRDTKLSAVLTGLSKYHISCPGYQFFGYPLDAFKPRKFHFPGFVHDMGHEPFFSTLSNGFRSLEPYDKLDMIKIRTQLVDLIKLAAVLVAERIMLQQVAKGKDVQFLVDQSRLLRPQTFQKINLGIKKSVQWRLIR